MNIKILFVIIIIGTVIIIARTKQLNNSLSKTIKISYETNYSLPFRYEYEIKDEDIVELVKKYTTDDTNGEIIDGAPVTTHYVFKGLKEGETTITFKSVSVENGSITWEEKKYIKVDKENNISIIKNKS